MANACISKFMTSLSRLFVFPLSFNQHRSVCDCIFPECEEVLIRLASFRRVARAELRADFVAVKSYTDGETHYLKPLIKTTSLVVE